MIRIVMKKVSCVPLDLTVICLEDIGIYKVSLPKNPDEAFDRLHSSFYVFNGTWKKDSRNQDGNFLGKFKESEGRVRVRFIYSYALENVSSIQSHLE